MVSLKLVTSLTITLFLLAKLSECKYTGEELEAIEKLRNSMDGQLYEDYMNHNEFLFPWLKVRDMNQAEAIKMLAKSLRWRKENNIDGIIEDEKQLRCDTYFPYESDAVDYNGRPVILTKISDWDVRKQVLAGRSENFIRCSCRMFELAMRKARSLSTVNQIANRSTHHSFVFIADFQGFNLRQHSCPLCVSTYLNTLVIFEANYPLSLSNVIFIKAPRVFETLLNVGKTVMSENTKNMIHVYGFDSTQWMGALLKEIPPDQLNSMYGGTKMNQRQQANLKH